MSTDVTAIKNAEADLIKSRHKLRQAHDQIHDISVLAHRDRLTSMGEMASAIIHELNQPLMVISGLSEVLDCLVSQEDFDVNQARELAQTIAVQTVQAGDIAHRMRNFVSNVQQNRERCNLNSIVQEAAKITNTRIRDDKIELVLALDPAGLWITADPIQIQQVIVNLILNSAEAMSNQLDPKPEILIETGVVEKDSVRLSVKDTGPGVRVDQQDKLFEAFETTKEDGMGMGLAISRSLIENHQGELYLDSDYPSGACFEFVLSKSDG